MRRLCIIPCGAKKIWDKSSGIGATKARDVYIGSFGRACQKYATTFFEDWVILSAKHGFLFPEDMIPKNYDVSFNSKSDEIISIQKLKNQFVDKELNQFDDVVVLGGKKYRNVIEKIVDKEKLVYPLLGCKGIGYMLQKLNTAVRENEEIRCGN